ncbi:methyl-accepting chemotaxis protein [Bacillus sp. FJAT-49736]|uniref:methyl-accepting chemotaxis protein n=1 Tax=Bacillus sp. FJAT-49736 TaxID=2833582 RepID=UPI001BC9D8D0|nr:methyl-accepting chemotaxis protein [Bacillus sp. FJAT-49736]MBS4174819.1 methyl-accepting chemotaxis protein [Bacillus sp. FJAT-49736]MBS4175524.1 methyl-accepting chemotaxis protein [Bacillus sp. FJAT-49736]
MKFIHSIKFKLPALMLLLLVVPLVIVGFMFYQKTSILEHAVIQKGDMEKFSTKFKNIFIEHEDLIKNFSSKSQVQFQTYNFTASSAQKFTNMPTVNDPVKEVFYQKFFKDFENKHEYLLNTYLATENGEFYLSNIPPEQVNLQQFDPRQRDWYIQAKKANGKVIWTEPYIDTGTGKSTITLAKAVTDSNGQIIGVVGFDFDMQKLAILIRDGVRNTTIIVTAIFLLIGIAAITLFIRNFNKILTSLRNGMAVVADGDLSIEAIRENRKDEMGELTKSFNAMVSNLKNLVRRVIDTSQQVAASSEQLSANADETSKASEQIADSIQEVSSGADLQFGSVKQANQLVSKISEDIYDISSRAEKVAHSSQEMFGKAQVGSDIVGKAIEQMENITTNTENTAKVITMLSKKSEEIEEIVTIINGIADQTNLLALNAAIEAARAGEHGKGFAVVADEVRKLAEQSSQSTKRIGEIIQEIQANTLKAVESMNFGGNAVHKGTELVGDAGTSFADISLAVNDVTERMLEVSQSIEQIHHHTNSLVESIKNVSNITDQTTEHTQEVAAATEEQTASMQEVSAATKLLANMAQELLDVANQFKV